MGELTDRVLQIVHGHGHASAGIIEHFMLDDLAVLAGPLNAHLALAGHDEVGGAILVAKGVASDDDRLGPARDKTRDILADDGFAEHDAAQDIADGAVRRLPHLLELEFFHPRFVGGDGGALNAHTILLNRRS